jgi:hypothetical protein
MKMDARLSVLLSGWTHEVDPKLMAKVRASAPESMKLSGKHPEVATAAENIPANCLMCHGRTSRRPRRSPPCFIPST